MNLESPRDLTVLMGKEERRPKCSSVCGSYVDVQAYMLMCTHEESRGRSLVSSSITLHFTVLEKILSLN